MKLALFDDYRLGVVRGEETIVDVTSALPHWDNGYAANFWLRLCDELETLRSRLEEAAQSGQGRPLSEARLRAPVLNPSKIIAAASNYGAHREEMAARRDRPAGDWVMDFDVFLKAPSSIIGPEDTIYLPHVPGREIHHESELAFVIGRRGKNIPEERALEHVLGYTILLDITVRGDGDRSRRKSYDGFTPIGPYVVTADEVGDPHNLRIQLWVNGQTRQDVNSGDMLTKIPAMIAYASQVMTLCPGDIFTTGSPPGVGQIADGDTLLTQIEKIGRMTNYVKAGPRQG